METVQKISAQAKYAAGLCRLTEFKFYVLLNTISMGHFGEAISNRSLG